MAKVALRFGCAKQSKNLQRYLISIHSIVFIALVALEHESRSIQSTFFVLRFFLNINLFNGRVD